MATITVNNDGSVSIDPAGISESHHLIDSNRIRCQQIFSKSQWRDGELIDGYIALHIVLEASLNSLFRQLALRSLKKDIDEVEVMKNIDRISFIDKMILFIYNSKFEFGRHSADAAKYHKIIGKLKSFCEVRNQLLHGHAVATVTDSRNSRRDTTARGNLSIDKLKSQLDLFRFIVDGMIFYVDCLSDLAETEKHHYKDSYLRYDFLPPELTQSQA